MTLPGKRVAIVIVSYRNSQDVCACLRALSAATPDPAFDVVICENGGSDAFRNLSSVLANTLTFPAEVSANFPTIELSQSIRLVESACFLLRERESVVWITRPVSNLGYAGAINSVVSALEPSSSWDAIWILNPDTMPEPPALKELQARSINGSKETVGSTILGFGDRKTIFCRAGHCWHRLLARPTTLGFRDNPDHPCDVPALEYQLDGISGASAYVTRVGLESVGPMDERFFLYYEDLDWGIRAKALGLGYASESVVRHRGGTTIGVSTAGRRNRSWLAIYLDSRNRLNFIRKHYPFWLPYSTIVSFLHALRYLMAASWVDFRVALQGIAAGLRGELGPPPRLAAEGFASLRPILMRPRGWRVKLALSAVFWTIREVSDFLRVMFGWRISRLTILYYHEIPSDFRFEFDRQMEMLKKRANVVPLDFQGRLPNDRPNVAISFDDACSSVATNAVPKLKILSFPFTVFVPAAFLGRNADWSIDPGIHLDETIMTEEQLIGLPAELATIGSHSLNHVALPDLDDDTLRNELVSSRSKLSAMIGRPVRLIAPPYGAFNRRVVEMCIESGYDRVYTTVPRSANPTSKTVHGRVRVDPWDGPIEFFLKINGAYSWQLFTSAIIRRVPALQQARSAKTPTPAPEESRRAPVGR